MSQKPRIEWIDNAKFFCIVLIVMGHVGMPEPMTRFFTAFRVPLFFFLSGFLYNYDALAPKVFLKKKLRTLVLPYFLFSAITYTVWVLFTGLKQGVPGGISPWIPFIGIFYSVGDGNFLAHDIPLWFITCLFVVEAYYYFLIAPKKGWNRWLALMICSIVGYLCPIVLPFRLPWSADSAFIGVVFYALGREVKNGKAESIFGSPAAAVCFFLTVLGASQINGKVDLNHLILGNYFLYFLAACSGISCSVFLAKKMASNPLSRFFGRHTAPIMAFHLAGINFLHFLRTNSTTSVHVSVGVPLYISCLDTIFIFFLMVPCILAWDKSFRWLLKKIDTGQLTWNPKGSQQLAE